MDFITGTIAAIGRWISGEPERRYVVNREPIATQSTAANLQSENEQLVKDSQDLTFSGEKSVLIWKQDTTEVGCTTVFEVCLFCKNGQPYHLTAMDTFRCEVLINQTAITSVTEPAKGGMEGHDKIVVSFNPTLAGKYRIKMDMNGHSIGGENYRLKEYKPGLPDPSKTLFNDQSEMFIVQKYGNQTLTLIPKDRYGNLIPSSDGIIMLIRKNNSEIPNAVSCVKWGQAGCTIIWQVLQEGFFTGTITHTQGGILRQFKIICLRDDDAAEVSENVSRKKACYNGQRCAHNKQDECVAITLSPHNIQLFTTKMRILTKKLHCFKVCPSTKIILHNDPNVFTIDNGCGMCITMSSKSRELIAATYHQFRADISGGSMCFTEKQRNFYDQLKKHHFGAGDNCNTIVQICISRQHLLETAIEATQNFKKGDWIKHFKVKISGEDGIDAGGLSREFFELLTEHCFSSKSGMFKAVNGSPQALVHPCTALLRPPNVDLSYYKFAGRIMGKCILECALGKPLLAKARFTRSFLVQILGLKATIQCLETDDPQMYNSITNYSVSNLDLFFVCEEYDVARTPKVVPLKKKGRSLPVTDENKMEYLSLLTEYRMMTSVKNEIAAFIEGLNELIPEDLLALFDEKELELLMCGTTDVSIEDLRRHTVVEGSGPKWEETVSWFWVAVQGFTSEDMSKFLQFVTGSSRLPARGFADLCYPIRVQSLDGQHERLPSAATCFNKLLLPTYDSYQHLHSALLTAINEGSQGFSMS